MRNDLILMNMALDLTSRFRKYEADLFNRSVKKRLPKLHSGWHKHKELFIEDRVAKFSTI